MKILKLFCVLSVFFGSSSQAAEFFVLPGTTKLLVMGETKFEDVAKIEDYIASVGVTELVIKGPGGSLEAAFGIAKLVLDEDLNTSIPDGEDCASACAFIFSAGAKRKMGTSTRIGLHLPFVSLNGAEDTKAFCQSFRKTSETKVNNFLFVMQNLNEASSDCLIKTYQMGLMDISKLQLLFKRDGISEDVLEIIIRTLPQDMYWMEEFEASELGLAN